MHYGMQKKEITLRNSDGKRLLGGGDARYMYVCLHCSFEFFRILELPI
jgi:hypothetical protein